MMGLFVTQPWPQFYKKGMKTWEIRSYPTNYRGKLLIIESYTNKLISLVELTDCIPLSKELWEMNYEKHRTAFPFDSLPYRKNNNSVYAWVIQNPHVFTNNYTISRPNKKPYIFIDDNILDGKEYQTITPINERLICKFVYDKMFIYWLKQNYIALVAITNITTGITKIITNEIKDTETDFILNQLNADQ